MAICEFVRKLTQQPATTGALCAKMWLGDYGGWMSAFINIVLVAAAAGGLIYGSMQWRRFRQNPREEADRD